jgi:hypothetical protein
VGDLLSILSGVWRPDPSSSFIELESELPSPVLKHCHFHPKFDNLRTGTAHSISLSSSTLLLALLKKVPIGSEAMEDLRVRMYSSIMPSIFVSDPNEQVPTPDNNPSQEELYF